MRFRILYPDGSESAVEAGTNEAINLARKMASNSECKTIFGDYDDYLAVERDAQIVSQNIPGEWHVYYTPEYNYRIAPAQTYSDGYDIMGVFENGKREQTEP